MRIRRETAVCYFLVLVLCLRVFQPPSASFLATRSTSQDNQQQALQSPKIVPKAIQALEREAEDAKIKLAVLKQKVAKMKTAWHYSLEADRLDAEERYTPTARDLPGDNPRGLVWLLSFPNSGTSYTITTSLLTSRLLIATNYFAEARRRDYPVVDNLGTEEGGPFYVDGNSLIEVKPPLILTKTHCKHDYVLECPKEEKKESVWYDVLATSEPTNPKFTMLDTNMSFVDACAEGLNNETEIIHYTKETLASVRKAIHILRHPFDNIVSRYHLLQKEGRQGQNVSFSEHCKTWDWDNPGLFDCWEPWLPHTDIIPCWQDLLLYVTWHNQAFQMAMEPSWEARPIKYVYYEDYHEDLRGTWKSIFDWLGLKLPEQLRSKKPYVLKQYHGAPYYNMTHRKAIKEFLRVTATSVTWQYLQHYCFEEHDSICERQALLDEYGGLLVCFVLFLGGLLVVSVVRNVQQKEAGTVQQRGSYIIQEAIETGDTKRNPADIFTEPFARENFKKLHKLLVEW